MSFAINSHIFIMIHIWMHCFYYYIIYIILCLKIVTNYWKKLTLTRLLNSRLSLKKPWLMRQHDLFLHSLYKHKRKIKKKIFFLNKTGYTCKHMLKKEYFWNRKLKSLVKNPNKFFWEKYSRKNYSFEFCIALLNYIWI